jgi:hypothetical protein
VARSNHGLSLRETVQVQRAHDNWAQFEKDMGRDIDPVMADKLWEEMRKSAISHRTGGREGEPAEARIDVMSPADRFNPVRARSRLTGDPNIPASVESGVIPSPTKLT